MRLMFTTALASAVMFAGPALAAGDKIESTAGMSSPERNAAQLPGGAADAGKLKQNFASAGFTDWQAAKNAQIFHMQSDDGQPVWVLLMPEKWQVGSAEQGENRQPGDFAEGPGSALQPGDLPEGSQQAEAGDMPQRGERADMAETFEGSEAGEQQQMTGGQDLPGAGERPDIAQDRGQDLPDIGEPSDLAEAPDVPEPREEGVAEAQDMPRGAEQRQDLARTPDVSEPGIAGQTQPEGFAAQIPGQLRSDLEDAGFQQVKGVQDAQIFRTRTEDGRIAFVIHGDLSAFGGLQQPGAPGQTSPGAQQQ